MKQTVTVPKTLPLGMSVAIRAIYRDRDQLQVLVKVNDDVIPGMAQALVMKDDSDSIQVDVPNRLPELVEFYDSEEELSQKMAQWRGTYLYINFDDEKIRHQLKEAQQEMRNAKASGNDEKKAQVNLNQLYDQIHAMNRARKLIKLENESKETPIYSSALSAVSSLFSPCLRHCKKSTPTMGEVSEAPQLKHS